MNKNQDRIQCDVDQPVFTRRCDIAGNGIYRTFRQQVYARILPMGNFRGGAGLRCLLVLSVLHGIGRPVFRILIRYERQLAALYRWLQRVREKS